MAEEVEMCVEIASKIDNTWIEKADINLLCRACASETDENMIPIFEGTGLELDLQAKIDKHFPVKIKKDDGLPNKMCVQCASTLVAWHDIYTGCTDAETKLKNLLNKSKDNAHTGEKVAGSSVESEDPVTEKPKSQQKVAGEMEVDDNDSDYIYEGDEDDDDYVQDDDDDIDEDGDEEQDTEEVVIEKLDSKEKGKTVEITDKGTIIRDQIMVLRKDINKKQWISFVLNMNQNDKTLELWSGLPEYSDVEENGSVINEVVKYVRDNYELNDDDTLAVEFNCTSKKPDSKIDSHNDLNATNSDMEVKKARSNTSKQSYHCKECNLRYRLRHNFEAHMNEHESTSKASEDIRGKSSPDLPPRESIYNEPDVDQTVKKSSYPKRHKKRPVKSVCCKLCNKQLRSRNGLLSHMKYVHEGVKEHACDICGRCFAGRASVVEHRRIHTGEKPFTCDVCGKSVRTHAILFTHLKCHSDVRPYVCSVCNKPFKYSHQLTNHSAFHTGEKNFVCDKCGKSFMYRVDLKRHILIHNGLKPFECNICYLMFNQRRYLKKHLLRKHHLDVETASTIMRNVKAQNQPGPVVKNISQNESESETTMHHTEEIRVNETEQALQVLKNVETNEKQLIEANVFNPAVC